MGQVSAYLRRATGAYMHWCPGCKELHQLPDRWSFNGDVNKPTFSPSFKHTLHRWDGFPDLDIEQVKRIGHAPGLREVVCHYILTDGILNFCGDCWHDLNGKSVPLPVLPDDHADPVLVSHRGGQ